jgi:aquaporin Z
VFLTTVSRTSRSPVIIVRNRIITAAALAAASMRRYFAVPGLIRSRQRRVMTGKPTPDTRTDALGRQQYHGLGFVLRSFGTPNATFHEFDFWDSRYEGRRLFSELLGTFFLVLVAVGGGMVNARFGGHAVPYGALVVAPALMVAAIILFMGAVSGAHLNPGVSLAFALRGDFPWKRVPAYIVAQFVGAISATLLLWALIGKHGAAGLTLPGHGISSATAMLWEIVLTAGLVSTILGTASGAQQLGPIAAIGVASYIALAGLWGSPVSGASMNTARSLGPALVLGDWRSWWAYLVGPIAGAIIAVGIAYVLRGAGGGRSGRDAAQGTLGETWRPGPFDAPSADPASPPAEAHGPTGTAPG